MQHVNIFALITISGLSISQPAYAEEGAEEKILAPVKTTATSQTDIQTRTELGTLTPATPISGTAVAVEELEELQLVNNLLELGKRVPGISMIRNMRIPDGGKQYTENRIDGMRTLATNTSVLDEIDGANIERIEIITGPGSALYGSGSLGGTISVFTKEPPQTLGGRISQELGEYGFTRTQGRVGSSSADGRWGFIVNASTMHNDGWRKAKTAIENGHAAAENKSGIAFKGFFKPADGTKITLGLDQLHYDYRWAGTLPLPLWEQDWQQVVPGTYGQSVDDYTTQSLRWQQLVGQRGELNLAYARRSDDSTNYGGAGSGGSNNAICDNKSIVCATVNNGSKTPTNTLRKGDNAAETTTAVYRHEFDWSKTNLYFGVEQSKITIDAKNYNNSYTAREAQNGYWGVGTLTSPGSLTTEKATTPFYHIEISPLDKLRLHIGQRFDRITYVADDRSPANKDTERTFAENVWKTGATYDVAPGHLVWLNWSQTFNAPASSTLLDTTSGGVFTPGTRLDPERGITREIGFRGVFIPLGLRYDVTYYNSRNRGFVVNRDCTAAETAQYGKACSINENAGSLTASGIESTWTWAAQPWLDIGATYVNARAYYNDYQTPNFNYTGLSFQAMPRERLNLRLAFKPAPGWKAELEVDHISSYFYDKENTGSYARPDLLAVRVGYRQNQWSYWLHVLNLTDKKYATRVSKTTVSGQSQLAASAGQGNSGSYAPRTFRAGISYNF